MEIKTKALSCPKCAAQNGDTAKFCKACGFDVRNAVVVAPQPDVQAGPVCVKCKTTNAPTAKFCKTCGTPTAKPSLAPSPADVATMPEVATPPAPAPQMLANKAPSPQPPVQLKPASVSESTVIGDIPSVVQPTASKRYIVWGSALTAALAVAGAGIYWQVSGSTRPSYKPASAQINPVAPATTPTTPTPQLAAVPTPTTAPITAAAPASPAAAELPLPPVTPNIEIKPEEPPKQPAPATVQPEVQTTPSAQDKRKTEEAAIKKRAQREAIAKQRERDKAKLNQTNRTLDDLLK